MVDTAVIARGGLMRRNIEKPRPLRTDPDRVCLAEILRLVEEVSLGLTLARNSLETRKKTQQLKELLRLSGQSVEAAHKDSLDKLEVGMRNACFDMQMDIITRLNILEMIELRLNNWVSNPVMATMYRQKLAEAQLDIDMKKIGYSGGGGDEQSHQLIRNLATLDGATRNTNMGDKVGSQLTQPDLKYSSSLVVNGHRVQISSSSDQIVHTSKDVLLEFFSIVEENEGSSLCMLKPEISYEKDELLRLSKSPLCRDAPRDWEKIVNEFPHISKKEGAPSKHFLREMEMLKKQEAARKM